jgi:transposase
MNNNTKSILGIDISKHKFDASLHVGARTWRTTFGNHAAGFKALQQWLKEAGVGQLHAALESTSRYGLALARFLHAQGFTVSILNPLAIHHYARSRLQRSKHDRLDADLIAEYVAKESPPAWTPPSAAHGQLQELSRLLQTRKRQRAQERNRLESLPQSRAARAAIQRFVRVLEKEIIKLETQLLSTLEVDPQLLADWKLLLSIPAIGELTAAILLAELPRYLPNARAAAAYTGLTPTRQQSGTRDTTQGLSTLGNHTLRRALYFPALAAMRFNGPIAAKAQRLRAKNKPPMCIVGAAMHQLLRQAWGVLNHKQPFDPAWTAGSLISSRAPA